jgi:hypothetical protein
LNGALPVSDRTHSKMISRWEILGIRTQFWKWWLGKRRFVLDFKEYLNAT